MFQDLVKSQKLFFDSQQTKSLHFRQKALKKLKDSILSHKQEILQALSEDLGKHFVEGYMSEVAQVLEEISHALKDLKKYTKPQKVKTPITHFGGRSEVVYEPYGVVLVISPWNYPFALSLIPLVGAIASGNCVILKPSSYSKNTETILEQILCECFASEYVCMVKGGHQETQVLLEEKLDYIFFTGSVPVGKIVMEKASKNLIPLTLELGGKNPCILDKDVDLDMSVKRIVWGKFFNSGQTCIAPDFLLAHKSHQNELIAKIMHYLQEFFGEEKMQSSSYGKIITQRHYTRAKELLEVECGEVIGGGFDDEKHKIEPTIINFKNLEKNHEGLLCRVMQEEIFAPILPIFFYEDIKECIDLIKTYPKPLALYLFSQDKKLQRKIVEEIPYGGGCMNDCIVQVANAYLPFGGVGHSGMGSYHGSANFETFSHKKSIYYAPKFELPLRYPPYSKKIFWIAREKILDFLFAGGKDGMAK